MIEEKCGHVKSLLRTFCDLSKYTGKDTKAAYKGFEPFRNAFLGSIVRNYKLACLKGTAEWIIVKHDGQFSKQPILHKLYMTDIICARYVIFLFTLWFIEVDEHQFAQNKITEKFYSNILGHQTVVLMDKESKIIKILDPHGSVAPWSLGLTNAVRSFFRMNAVTMFFRTSLEDFKISSLEESCPRLGPQLVADDSFCLMWSLLITYLTLACPNELYSTVEQLANLGKQKLQRLVQGWLCYAWAYVDITGIVEAYNFWRKTKFSEPMQTAYEENFQTGNMVVVQKLIEIEKHKIRTGKTENYSEVVNGLYVYEELDDAAKLQVERYYQEYLRS